MGIETGTLLAILGGVGAGVVGSSLLAPKPTTPKLPEPVPLPKTQDLGKIKAGEKRQLQKRSTQTTFSSNWLSPPTLLTNKLG